MCELAFILWWKGTTIHDRRVLVLGMPLIEVVERDDDATANLHRAKIPPPNGAAHRLVMDRFALRGLAKTKKGALFRQSALLNCRLVAQLL